MTQETKGSYPGIFAMFRAQAATPRGPVRRTLFGRPILRAV
jgi:hypothetical protein